SEEIRLIVNETHALSAASKGRLNEQWEAVLVRERPEFLAESWLLGNVNAFQSRKARNFGGGCDLAGARLARHLFNRIGIGTDPDHSSFDYCPGEAGVLRQKAVTGMDGVGAKFSGGGD